MFGLFKDKKKVKRVKPDIRYGDPSHDSSTWKKKPEKAKEKPSSSKISHFISKKVSSKRLEEISIILSDQDEVERITLGFIRSGGRDGLETTHLNKLILRKALGEVSEIAMCLKIKKVTDQLHDVRVKLSKRGDIGFNSFEKVWYPKEIKTRNITDKEDRFLKAKGIKSEGWVSIPHKLEAIRWLHKNFSPDEFEQFCCELLKYSHVHNVCVTEKRLSGADGGLDGTGDYTIENEIFPIIFEAKCYNPDKQVGEDICTKLAGVMMREKVKHGFIITTAQFSDRAVECVNTIRENEGYQIELIDQDRMAEIMIFREESPHGLGLHRTDAGFIYMNQNILRNTVTK